MTFTTISQNLELFGNRYKSENLNIDVNQLNLNSFEALKFFLGHSFMRGRRDELSNKYFEFTIEVLSNYFTNINDNNSDNISEELKIAKERNLFDTSKIKQLKSGRSNSIKHEYFENQIKKENPLINILTTESKTKKICLQNDADLLMVLDTLDFMASSKEKSNLYKYFNGLIINNQIGIAYGELNRISGIADKISTFILRDIVIINDYTLDTKYLEYIFPVDTWVAQIASLLADKEWSARNSSEIKGYFKDSFPDSNLPLIAAGIWYLGSNSLTIALECMKNYPMNKV